MNLIALIFPLKPHYIGQVCLASLDCLASAQGESGSVLPISPTVWAALGADKPALLARLARIMQTHVHIECRRQSLRVLVLEGAYGCIFGEEYQPGYVTYFYYKQFAPEQTYEAISDKCHLQNVFFY